MYRRRMKRDGVVNESFAWRIVVLDEVKTEKVDNAKYMSEKWVLSKPSNWSVRRCHNHWKRVSNFH